MAHKTQFPTGLKPYWYSKSTIDWQPLPGAPAPVQTLTMGSGYDNPPVDGCACFDCQQKLNAQNLNDENGEDYVERTLVVLKPDAFERNLVGEIMALIDQKDLELVASKQLYMSPEDVAKHYSHHVGKGFYPFLEQFMTSGPSLALVYEGKQACAAVRQLIGNKHPSDSPAGSIRGKYAMEFPRNLIHGSDPGESEHEIQLYFTEDEIFGKKYKSSKSKLEKQAAKAAEVQKQEAIAAGPKLQQFIKYPEMLIVGQTVQYAPNGATYKITNVSNGDTEMTLWVQRLLAGTQKVIDDPLPISYTHGEFPSNAWKLIGKP